MCVLSRIHPLKPFLLIFYKSGVLLLSSRRDCSLVGHRRWVGRHSVPEYSIRAPLGLYRGGSQHNKTLPPSFYLMVIALLLDHRQ